MIFLLSSKREIDSSLSWIDTKNIYYTKFHLSKKITKNTTDAKHIQTEDLFDWPLINDFFPMPLSGSTLKFYTQSDILFYVKEN